MGAGNLAIPFAMAATGWVSFLFLFHLLDVSLDVQTAASVGGIAGEANSKTRSYFTRVCEMRASSHFQ